jgi:NADH-quinone oxidoreductase subunit L
VSVLHLLWLVPAFPILGFLVLAFAGARLPRKASSTVGVASIGASAVVSILVAASFLMAPPAGGAFRQTLWSWIDIGWFRPQVALYLDALSLVMTTVVTVVSFLIHLYSAEFMAGDDGLSRFFAYMNLFVASMVTLLLADNLLLLYVGWEGVGLCSYLLIGFWYRDPANGLAARKAFIVTRVGDTAMALGLFLLFTHLVTLDIQASMDLAAARWPVGSGLPIAAAALLLGGAVGKSAQLPLQTWLPDAMAGPTPTSALIHAATMVTAGVYLIARMHVLYELAPPVQLAVAIVGASTLVMAGFSALTQRDIKRVLAYSTISQIGYMFLALGVGAWTAAIFHFMTHAFFKALLFLVAGIVIQAMNDEHSIFRMGGLRRLLPVAFWTFLIGGCSLSGLPFLTAGFYSKDLIIWAAWSSPRGGWALWSAALFGVLLTGLYTFRVIFLVFFGEPTAEVEKRPGPAMTIPVIVLAALSLVGGLVELPPWLGDVPLFSRFLSSALPPFEGAGGGAMSEGLSGLVAAVAFFGGLYAAYVFFVRRRSLAGELASSGPGRVLHRLWFADWGFDWVYDHALVKPIVWFARVNKGDAVDVPYGVIARVSQSLHRGLSLTETGRVRWYAAGVAAGAVIFVGIALIL